MKTKTIAWGAKVSKSFLKRLIQICNELGIDPNYLMACMAFETGRTFDPAIRNAAGSGAVGLIQFMPSTAMALGTTTGELAEMTGEEQIEYVRYYFRGRARVNTLSDVYMAILWPAAIGKPEDYVLFNRADAYHPKRYVQNAGLDYDGDGLITKAEASARVQRMLNEGLKPENIGEIEIE